MVKEHMRLEAAFFESVRVLVMRLLYNPTGKKFSHKEINDRINELLKQSVKSETFSELIQQTLNRYLNGMLPNEEVIQELLKLAKEMLHASEEGNLLGLSDEEMAFYDALTKPEAVKDFYTDEELVALTRELTETLRKNKTIDWQKKESARAKMRMIVKKLLKKYKYPPEGQEDALKTVISQCELWTDNVADFENAKHPDFSYESDVSQSYLLVADTSSEYRA